MPLDNDGRAPDTDAAESPEARERHLATKRGAERHQRHAALAPRGRDLAHLGGERYSMAAHAFAALADNVRDYAIFLMDPHGVITYWGEGAHLIKWWTRDETEGGHLRLLYPPFGAEDGTAEEHLQNAAAEGEYTGEGSRVRRDGSTFWAGITLTALRNHEGELVGFAKVTRDLTARRAADALLQLAASTAEQARAAAESASAAKSAFLATMSHEIRTPIHAIMGYHQLLEMDVAGTLSDGQRQFLARAADSARHLLELVTHVLEFSSVEAERREPRGESVRLGELVSESIAMIDNQARARGVTIVDAVSGFAASLVAHGDPIRIRQILVNLVSNAIKFTDRIAGETGEDAMGRVTISAGTTLQPPEDVALDGGGPWVYIRVEDTGSGIAADQLESIFEPFVQADMSFTRMHEGVGLGLAISRRLARMMRGDVTVRSELGLGSTFLLWLPASPVESMTLQGEAGIDRLRAEDPTGSRAESSRQSEDAAAGDSGIANVGAVILLELETVLQRYVARVRADAQTASAHHMTAVDIEDNLATFLADIAATIRLVSSALPSGPAKSDQLHDGLQDATAIQRLISARHGSQRARLGWREAEVGREFEILREELTDAVRRRTPQRLNAPGEEAKQLEVERALEALDALLAIAEGHSVTHFREEARQRPAGAVR